VGNAHKPYITEAKDFKLFLSITSGTFQRTNNLFTNRLILITPNIYIAKSIMVCGHCPPYWDSIYHFTLRSLARIANELAISKISEYLSGKNEFANLMSGELTQVYRLGIVPDLWKCERNRYSGTLSSIIETIQEKEGLYNPDFSDRSHPLFDPYTARLRYFLLGNTDI
jgi:hypothetical protein